MIKQRIYLDTSVIGGCFDKEFEKPSKLLFEAFKNDEYIPVISETVVEEVSLAPEMV